MSIKRIRNHFLKLQEKNKKEFSIGMINKLLETRYVYHFDWLGVPSIQFPSDLMVLQEIIFKTKPDVIIETGVAHGGTLLFYSSILNLIKKNFQVIGVDIKVKVANRKKIMALKNLSKKIKLFEASSTDQIFFKKIQRIAKNKRVMVILDSNHTHDHVLAELKMYSNLIKKNDYLIVMDTITEFIDQKFINKGREFKRGNSPYTATIDFLKYNNQFKIDKTYENKSFICGALSGFLKKIK
jgi:cephalosporin hydroxylase